MRLRRDRLFDLGLFAAAAALIVARAPALLTDPRFWAEEGRLRFAYAYAAPWYDALFATHAAHLSLFANAAAVLATAVPLESAPAVTTVLAFAAQLLPIVVILTSRAELWETTARRAVGLALVLFTADSGEVWLNTINSQFHFSLVAFLLLLEPVRGASGRRLAAQAGLLAACGLSGAVSVFLFPAYLVRAWIGRGRDAWTLVVVLGACGLVQAAAILTTPAEASLARRFAELDLWTWASIVWTRTMLLPFAGMEPARAFAFLARAADQGGSSVSMWLGALVLVIELSVVTVMARRLERGSGVTIVVAYGVLTLLSSLGATGSNPQKLALVEPTYAPRYFYAPSVMLGVLALANIDRRVGALRVLVGSLLVASALWVGVSRYDAVTRTGPRWAEEVALWREDPTRALAIWPRGWSMNLPGR